MLKSIWIPALLIASMSLTACGGGEDVTANAENQKVQPAGQISYLDVETVVAQLGAGIEAPAAKNEQP